MFTDLRATLRWAAVTLPLFVGLPSAIRAQGPPACPHGQIGILPQAVWPTTPPGGRTWHLTADFSVVHRATLLLVADAYGRFRPRLAYDAPVGPLAVAASASSSGR